MKLRTTKKRVNRYLKTKPCHGEVSLCTVALRRALEANPYKASPDIRYTYKRFQEYLAN